MLVNTQLTQSVMNLLNKDPIVNLNILGVLENTPEVSIFVDNVDNPKGILVKKGYFHYLYTTDDGFLEEAMSFFEKDGFYGFSAVENTIAEKLKSKLRVTWESPCDLYYLPKENLDISSMETLPAIDIKDAEIVDEFYTYRSPSSLEHIKEDINNRPSSAIYVDGELVCWCLVHGDNSMGIMYTKEGFRKKGYAERVALDLAAKIIKEGKTPFLQIVKSNSMSPGLAKKCGFIPHGEVTWFGIVVGVPQEIKNAFIELKNKFIGYVGENLRATIESTDQKGYYICIDESIKEKANQLIIEEAKEHKQQAMLKEILAKTLNLEKNYDDFSKLINAEDITPIIGIVNGRPVAAALLLKLDEESYGVFLLTSILDKEEFIESMLYRIFAYGKEKGIELLYLEAVTEYDRIVGEMGFMELAGCN